MPDDFNELNQMISGMEKFAGVTGKAADNLNRLTIAADRANKTASSGMLGWSNLMYKSSPAWEYHYGQSGQWGGQAAKMGSNYPYAAGFTPGTPEKTSLAGSKYEAIINGNVDQLRLVLAEYKLLGQSTRKIVSAEDAFAAEINRASSQFKNISGYSNSTDIAGEFRKSSGYYAGKVGSNPLVEQIRSATGFYNVSGAGEENMFSSLQQSVQGDKLFGDALQQAERLGFGIESLKSKVQDGAAGFQLLSFESINADGSLKKLKVSVDQAGNATVKSGSMFRTFGQTLMRNVESFVQWSIALSVVYLPMQKLQEGLSSMIQTQTQLANVTIALGNAHRDMYDIFKSASEIANELGVSVNEIVDVYANAYRATGRIADQNVRTAVTNQLLADSMLLAKLSGRSQAESLDDLVAAIEQTGVGLGNGQVLLDKWIRTTQLANVDLDTLVTTFALVSNAADDAGISVDQLNGLVATIAQKTPYSGREAGNRIRAIIAGFQQEGVSDVLGKVGINLEDYESIFDVLVAISEKKAAGLIDPDTWEELTFAIGAGTKQMGVVSTLLENMGLAQDIAAESAKAHGEAEDALAKQLGTVQTALTRLDNAFKSLATTLGLKGGILETITLVVDGMSSLLNIMNQTVDATGSLVPQVVALGIAFAALNSPKLGGSIGMVGQAGNLTSVLGLGMAAYNTYGAYKEGGMDQAAISAGGSAIGAMIGLVLGGPVGMGAGAAIGSSIADAFTAAFKVDNSISGIIYDLYRQNVEKGTKEGTAAGILSGYEIAEMKRQALIKLGGNAIGEDKPEWEKYIAGKGIVTGTQGLLWAQGLPADETMGYITALQGAISGLDRPAGPFDKRTPEERSAAKDDLQALLNGLKGASWEVGSAAAAAGAAGGGTGTEGPKAFTLPGMARYPTLSNAQTKLLVNEANRELVAALKAAGASDEEVTKYLKALETALIETKDGWLKFEKGSSFDPAFLAQAFDKLVSTGALPGKEMGIEKLDISSDKRGQLQQYLSWAGNLLSGMGYTMKPEELGVIYSDYVTDILHVDNMQLRLALERIAEIEQKQLDGMYNLPEGATFWVPLGAAGLRPTADGSGANVKEGGNLILRGAELFTDAVGKLMTIGSATNKDELLNDYAGSAGLDTITEADRNRAAMLGISIEELKRRQAEAANSKLMNPQGGGPASLAQTTGMGGGNIFDAGGTTIAPKLSTIGGATTPSVETSPIARIQLEIKDNITLTVDGRQMANVVKQYLWEDLVRAEKSGGAVQRKMIM